MGWSVPAWGAIADSQAPSSQSGISEKLSSQFYKNTKNDTLRFQIATAQIPAFLFDLRFERQSNQRGGGYLFNPKT